MQNNCYSYHLSTNDIKTILYYMLNDKTKPKFIIIDNYELTPINFHLLGLNTAPTPEEHRNLIFSCKFEKFLDCYFEQGYSPEKIIDLAEKNAKQETDFYFQRINEFNDNDY